MKEKPVPRSGLGALRSVRLGLILAAVALPMTATLGQTSTEFNPSVEQPAPMRKAKVAVDYGNSRGPLLRTERYNNLTRAHRWVDQRDADVQFYNEQGLHGQIYRVWIIAEDIHDPSSGRYNFEVVEDYLADVSRLSDELLIVMDTRQSIGKDRHMPEQIKPVIKTIMGELKRRFPQIKYIEAFNEPDHNLRDVITPEGLYDYYRVYYEAVNEINRELRPKVPLLVGGPATGSCGSPWAPAGPNNRQWIPKFLDRYVADSNPDKKLDFLSYHAYGYFKNQLTCSDYTPIRIDPSQLADQRARTDEELRKRGLDVNMPSFITETGPYPGPSYDNKQDPHPDYLRQATAMASYMYWYMENPKDMPFNWALRHSMEERKDQLLTRAGEDKPIPSRIFTPYGNQMLMFSKLKDERVAAQSDALQAGKGVYALATKDKSGAAVLVWNYQLKGTDPYRVTIEMSKLPAHLSGKSLRQRMFRIDDQISNYWGNPATANLQQVAETTVKPGQRHSVTVDLSANALHLVLLEPDGSADFRARSLPLVRTMDDRFQSYQVGFSHLTGGETWKAYDDLPKEQAKDVSQVREPRAPTDLSNRRLRNLTSALAPFYLRYSGTTANSVYFQDNDEPKLEKAPDGYKVVLTRRRWKEALEFAKAVNATVVTSFTTSKGVRDASNAWTSEMAAPWMAYTRSIGGEIYAAELFNEPNAPEFPHHPKGFSADEFGRDYAAFREFMAKAAANTKLAGPGNATLGIPGVESIMKPTPEDYANASPRPKFDIVSYHFYPVLAQRCAPAESPQGITADKALSEDFLARPDQRFQLMKALRDREAPGAPIWLTETGGAACGGLVWQPTFLDAFRYLDTQARLAKQGLDAMFTHALISGSNGVIDEKTFQPNASYWAAVLWRRLMGTRVLDAGPLQSGLHMYAHCQRGGSRGAVTVLAINLDKTRKTIPVSEPAEVYTLTAPELQSKTVLLNGQPLALGPEDELPAMRPQRMKQNGIALAPTSVSFIALPKANNPHCGA